MSAAICGSDNTPTSISNAWCPRRRMMSSMKRASAPLVSSAAMTAIVRVVIVLSPAFGQFGPLQLSLSIDGKRQQDVASPAVKTGIHEYHSVGDHDSTAGHSPAFGPIAVERLELSRGIEVPKNFA